MLPRQGSGGKELKENGGKGNVEWGERRKGREEKGSEKQERGGEGSEIITCIGSIITWWCWLVRWCVY